MNAVRRPESKSRAALAVLALSVVTVALLYTPLASAEPDRRDMTSRRGDLVSIFGGKLHVPRDVRQRGSVISVGGEVVIEGEVSDDVVVILGKLTLSGRVDGNVTAVMSEQSLSGARVDDMYVNVLGEMKMENSTVGDEFIHVMGPLEQDAYSTRPVVDIGKWFPSLWTFIFWMRMLRLLTVFVLVLVLAALVPERIMLIADEAPTRYVSAFFVGLAGFLALWIALVLLSVTVVGLPVALFAYYVLKWLGVAGIFFAIGRRLGRSFGREMSLLGAVFLTFAIYALLTLAPTPLGVFGLPLSIVFRLLFLAAIEIPAVGLIILTRIGTRRAANGTPDDVVIPVASPPALHGAPPEGGTGTPPAAHGGDPAPPAEGPPQR